MFSWRNKLKLPKVYQATGFQMQLQEHWSPITQFAKKDFPHNADIRQDDIYTFYLITS